MDRWVGGWVDEWTGGYTGRCMDKQMDGQTGGWMVVYLDSWVLVQVRGHLA